MPGRGKRKRSTYQGYGPFRPPRRKVRKKFIPGMSRTGGFYGRYRRFGEMKFFDTNVAVSPVTTAGTVEDSLNHIPQGTTESERLGRKCTIKHIGVRFQLTLAETDAVTTPPPADLVRCILFWDKQANGATAIVADLLENAGVDSFRNLANSQRFIFLYDKVHEMNYKNLTSDAANAYGTTQLKKYLTIYKRCNIPIEFDNSATTGAMGTIRSNNLGWLIMSETASATSMDGTFRIRFTDN